MSIPKADCDGDYRWRLFTFESRIWKRIPIGYNVWTVESDLWWLYGKIQNRFLTCVSITAHVIDGAARLSVCPSVRLSVRPSVTRWYCAETAQPIVKLSALPSSPMILVFEDQTFSRNSSWNTPTGALNARGMKSCNFRPMSRYSS